MVLKSQQQPWIHLLCVSKQEGILAEAHMVAAWWLSYHVNWWFFHSQMKGICILPVKKKTAKQWYVS
jgi:hypothetical protein